MGFVDARFNLYNEGPLVGWLQAKTELAKIKFDGSSHGIVDDPFNGHQNS